MANEDLSEEQQEFLIQCETDFANRYSQKDDDFTIVMQIGVSPPPIVEPWRPKTNNRQDGQRGRRRPHSPDERREHKRRY